MNTKEKILALLETNRGQSISGTNIAEELNISRNAVWKSVKELQKDGHKITAVTNKGYCLYEDSGILSAGGIASFLRDKSYGDKITVYKSIKSTSQTAKELATAGAEHGTIIIADCQTEGRGRYGRKFHSPAGHGIYMSLILHPQRLAFDSPTLITAFAALAVCEAIEAVTGRKPGIKWVNDIFLEGKKICGILTEAVTNFENGSIEWVVVGIGINFSTPHTLFPEELGGIAGSIFTDGKPTAARNQLAAEIINKLLTPEKPCNKSQILAEYKKRLIMLGQTVTVTGAGKDYEATAMDIDELGRLIVKCGNGSTKALSSGEISIKAGIVN